MDDGARFLLEHLPGTAGGFDGSEWSLPVAWAFLAGPPDPARLRASLQDEVQEDVKRLVEPALMAAEVIEAAQPDRRQHFIADNQARTYAFRGAKWRAGWVLLVGRRHHAELVQRFKQDRWLVFSTTAAAGVDVHLGDRPTALVYFAQLMVRYGFIFGLVAPGDDHELAHFLERDVPGVVVASGDLSPVESLLVLGLMSLGAPAVVPRSFPYDYGRRACAETVDEVVDAAGRFPNLRVRKTVAGQVALPDFCDPARRNEPFEPARSWGGSAPSWFCVRPATVPGGAQVEGEAGADLGVLVEIGHPAVNDLVTDWLEEVAGSAPSYIGGVKADLRRVPRIDLSDHARATPQQVAEAIRAVLRHQYPLLSDVRVTLSFDAETLARLRPAIEAFKARRREAIARLSDETVGEVYSCIDCQTFAHGHVCFLTPDRPSMCGTRPFLAAMASAYFGDVQQPWRRREVGDRPHQGIVKLGRCLDPVRGEFEGINRAARELSGGIVERVFLHDLRDHPHTSCGCFWAIAFYIPEMDGVGIMTRDYAGRAPDGNTWMTLANRAGGKQAPGMAGIGREYLASPAFLRGHGGLRSIVWASPTAAEAIRQLDPTLRFAVDQEVETIQDLKRFHGRP